MRMGLESNAHYYVRLEWTRSAHTYLCPAEHHSGVDYINIFIEMWRCACFHKRTYVICMLVVR